MPKVPERTLSYGEILERNKAYRKYTEPLNLRRLTDKRRTIEKKRKKDS